MAPPTSTSKRDRVKREKEKPPRPSAETPGAKRTQRVTRSQSRGLNDDRESVPPSRRGRQPSEELGTAKQRGGAENTKRGVNKRKRRMCD
jgi:hypothetical protein